MNEKEAEKIKEYSNLNNYYLKISLTEQNFSLIGLNTENLDNNLYQFNITEEEFEVYLEISSAVLTPVMSCIGEDINKISLALTGKPAF